MSDRDLCGFTGHSVNFGRLVREKKRAILETTFAASHELLTEAALKIARAAWQTRDLSPRHLREALGSWSRRCRLSNLSYCQFTR